MDYELDSSIVSGLKLSNFGNYTAVMQENIFVLGNMY